MVPCTAKELVRGSLFIFLTFEGISERRVIVQMMSRHGRLHPVIPKVNGLWSGLPEVMNVIYGEYAMAMAGLPQAAQAYLWANWYSPVRIRYWCHATMDPYFPCAWSTNAVESLWSAVKRSVICSRSTPPQTRGLAAL